LRRFGVTEEFYFSFLGAQVAGYDTFS
jgi:hypothetical protein